MGISTVYGSVPRTFYDTVIKFCDSINVHCPKGEYIMPKELYPDSAMKSHYHYDDDEFEQLFKQASVDEAERMCLDETLSSTKFNIIVNSAWWNNVGIKCNVYTNSATPPSILKLATTELDNNVKITCISENYGLTADMLEEFIDHCNDDQEVLLAIMEHPNVSYKILKYGG